MEINIDYVGAVILVGDTFKYTKFEIQKEDDTIAELNNMVDNPNRTMMDLQSLFQKRYPDKQYFHYSLPYSYNDSFIDGISYPPIWTQNDYEQELNNRIDLRKVEKHLVITELKSAYLDKCKRYIKGFGLKKTIEKLQSNPSVRMYSTEVIGRTTMTYKISSDITITLKTNFSYGSASYFFVNLNYKGIDFLPYSEIVRYYKVNMVDFIRHTRQYYPDRKYWDTALMFVVDTSNFANNNEREFLRQWCINEIKEMIKGLRDIKNCSNIQKLTFDESKQSEYVYVRNISAEEKNRTKVYPYEMTIVFKSEKITGALHLLTKMQQWTEIYEEVNTYIEDIKQMNIDILPEIEKAIVTIEKDIVTNKEEIENIRIRELKPLIDPITKWMEKEKIIMSEQEEIYINSEREKMQLEEILNNEEKNIQIGRIIWPSWMRENVKKEFRKQNKEYQELLTKRDLIYAKINTIEKDIIQRTNFISKLSECKSCIISAEIVASA